MAKTKKKSAKHKAAAKPKSKAKAKAPAKQARRATPAKPKPRSAPARSAPGVAAAPAAPAAALDDMDSLRNALGDILGDGDMPEPTIEKAGGRDAIHVELGAKLTATRGDLHEERAAIASAIDSFMRLAIANGLAPDASAYTAQCPEFFWEGDGANPPVYARVPDATHEEIGRWFKMIVEGVRAYDSRVGAVSPNAGPS